MSQFNAPAPGLLAFSLALAGGCATDLVPAPEALQVPSVGRAAEAERDGLEVIAAAAAWRGFPIDLDTVVTPLLVTLTNHTDHPLALRYEYFTLITPGGVFFAALPPFQLTGDAYLPVSMVAPPPGFTVAPYLSAWYPTWPATARPFPYHSIYYDTYASTLDYSDLPTADMLQKALPEGVLAPGARITGFIYFEEVEYTRRVDFVTRMVDADTGDFLGNVAIPFVTD